MTRPKARKSARKAKPAPGFLEGITSRVIVERGSGQIVFENVPAAKAPALLASVLRKLRTLARTHGELVPELGQVGGYCPVPYEDDEWADGRRRRIGFR
jgi:hypothetical protein